MKMRLVFRQSSFNRCYAGITLIELVMALGLGMAISAAIIQQYLAMTQLREMQGGLQRAHESSAYARHLISDAIRRASALRCAVDNPVGQNGWVQIWQAGEPDAAAEINALPGSAVVSLLDGDCPSPLRSIYFLAYRGQDPKNPPALFVRRQRPDGSYSAAEELVEGISAFAVQLVAAELSESNEVQFFLANGDGSTSENLDPILLSVTLQVMARVTDLSETTENKVLNFHVAGRQYSSGHSLPGHN